MRRLAVVTVMVVFGGVLAGCLPPPPPPPVLQSDVAAIAISSAPYGSRYGDVFITNTGGATLGPLAVSIHDQVGTGSFRMALALCQDFDQVLPPGDSCGIRVVYDNPTGTGSGSAWLHVEGGGSTLEIPLNGSGDPGGLEVVKDASTYGSPPITVFDTTAAMPTQSAHFLVVNTSLGAIGPMHLALANTSGTGTFDLYSTGTCEGTTLTAGNGCGGIGVSYTNGTGAGSGGTKLTVSASAPSLPAIILGFGH